MGMDVYGRAPTSEVGQYFRSNVWYWRPLWNYCMEVAPELCKDVSGHTNDGDGLDATGAAELADILTREIDSGRTAQRVVAFHEYQSNLERHTCTLCSGTGIRTDEVGQLHNMPTKVLEPHLQSLLGRSTGWCNSCRGEGLVEDHEIAYRFDEDIVRDFADFLHRCGGFSIC